MQDAIAQLCKIVEEKLRDEPKVTPAELMVHVETAIAANPQLEATLRANPQMLQINRDSATGYQIEVKGGIVYAGGTQYVLSDPDKLKAALEAVLIKLQTVYQPVGIPKNLPDRTKQFVGREAVMEELHTQLQQTERVYLQGMGGIGKTELALQYAWKHYKQGTYPAGICWLRVRDQDVGTQIVNFARVHLALTVRDDLGLPERIADCWQRWPQGNVLVVFDDVWSYEAIAPYLPPQESRFKVLLTTRSYLGSSVKQFEIQVLSEEASLDLLRSLAGKERIDQQLDEAQNLARWLGYLPLGLELVGRYLAQKPDLSLAEMQQRLEKQKLAARALVKREAGMTATHESVAAAFELSWQELDEPACQLSYLLSLFALAPIPWELVESCLSDWNEEDLEDTRDLGLVNRSLLQRVGEGTYQLHQFMREFFRLKLNTSEGADDWKHRYCETLIQVAQQILPSPTQDLILAITPTIPHLAELATTLNPWVKDEDLIWAFEGVARFYQGQGAYASAQPYRERCLSRARGRLGEEHLDVATGLNNLAELYRTQGAYGKAEPLYKQALALSQRVLGEEHPNVATSFNNLALLYDFQGRYGEAESLHVQALALRQRVLDKDHPDVAASLNNLASLYRSQGRYGEAVPLYIQALAITRRAFGENHPNVAANFNNLAVLYFDQGNYSEAELLFEQALTLRRQVLGEEHPDVANSLNNLASLYCFQGQYSRAESLLVQALDLRRQVLGEEHLDVANSLNSLASLYYSQGRYSEAEPLYEQALELIQQMLGEEHPTVATNINNLASLYYSQGRYLEAEPLYEQALALRKRVLGEDHPDVANSLNSLAALYDSQGRYSEAEPLYEQALALRKRVLGKDHPDVANSLNNLALLYDSQGRYLEAEPLYEQALEIVDRQLGATHPNTLTFSENLAKFYSERAASCKTQGLYEEAAERLQKAIEVRYRRLNAKPVQPHQEQQ